MTVRKGLCPSCGRVAPTWTPDAIIRALQAWQKKHGRNPGWNDWQHAGHGHPTAERVRHAFGSWADGLKAAGLQLAPTQRRWTEKQCVQALFEWRLAHGRMPTHKEWRRAAEGRPTYFTILNLFGSWNTFLEYAGYPVTKKWTRRDEAAA